MVHGIVSSQGLLRLGGEFEPGTPEPIAEIDFANGIYLYNGVPVAVGDLLEQDANWVSFNEASIVPGFGLKEPEFGATCGPVFKGALLADMLAAGFTIVFDFTMGEGGLLLMFVDFPDFDNAWTFDAPFGASPDVSTDYDSAFAENSETLAVDAAHKIALTMMPGKFSISTNGGLVDTDTPTAPGTPFTDVAWSIAGTSGSPFYMRSVKVYEPQADADLPALSV